MLTRQSFYQYGEPGGGLRLSNQKAPGEQRCIFPKCIASVSGEMETRFPQRTRSAIRHVLARSLSLRENAGACLEYETSSCHGGNDVK